MDEIFTHIETESSAERLIENTLKSNITTFPINYNNNNNNINNDTSNGQYIHKALLHVSGPAQDTLSMLFICSLVF